MRRKKEMSWQSKAYGVIVIILMLWMLIDAMINGRVQDETVLYGAVFSLKGGTP